MRYRSLLWSLLFLASLTAGCSSSSTGSATAPAEGEIAEYLKEHPEEAEVDSESQE